MSNPKEYDYLIVGAGLFGSVFAQQAREKGKKCLIIDQRDHIGGNCYSEKIEGIEVHKYGPHIFHTNDYKIWSYVQRFTEFNNFINRPKVNYNNKLYSFPINLMTLNQVYGVKTPEEARQKIEEVRVPSTRPKNLEEWILNEVGPDLYEMFIKGYTTKHWGRDPKELSASIIKRLPIRFNMDDNYFKDRYQGVPVNGYTQMIRNMQEGIDVKLGVDYLKNRDYFDGLARKVVYTGAIDAFFNYSEGELAYRSLNFELEILPVSDFQGNALVNYTDVNVPWNRICEHKHFNWTKSDITVISKDFPVEWRKGRERYYPLADAQNESIYKRYKERSKPLVQTHIFWGRLAEYKYYDMHQVIGSALKKFREDSGLSEEKPQ